jgi:hypothetical protein
MMPAQITSKSISWLENSDTCVATRFIKVGTTWPGTIVYSGVVDLQERGGGITYNAGGVVQMADAIAIFDGLPDIRVDDQIVFNGAARQTFVVVSVNHWTMSPQNVECALKYGPIAYSGKT